MFLEVTIILYLWERLALLQGNALDKPFARASTYTKKTTNTVMPLKVTNKYRSLPVSVLGDGDTRKNELRPCPWGVHPLDSKATDCVYWFHTTSNSEQYGSRKEVESSSNCHRQSHGLLKQGMNLGLKAVLIKRKLNLGKPNLLKFTGKNLKFEISVFNFRHIIILYVWNDSRQQGFFPSNPCPSMDAISDIFNIQT